MRIASLLIAGVASVSLAMAQQQAPPQGYMTVIPQQTLPSNTTDASTSVLSVTPLPMWNYSLTSPIDSKLYSGTIVGRSPYNRAKGTTTIPTQVVPLIITINEDLRSHRPGCLHHRSWQSLHPSQRDYRFTHLYQ